MNVVNIISNHNCIMYGLKVASETPHPPAKGGVIWLAFNSLRPYGALYVLYQTTVDDSTAFRTS